MQKTLVFGFGALSVFGAVIGFRDLTAVGLVVAIVAGIMPFPDEAS